MPIGDEDLWQAVYAAFPYPLERVQQEINRIAVKCLRKAGVWTGLKLFDSSTCDVSAVLIPGNELADLVRYHKRASPVGRTTPIVVVRAGGKDVVIEGSNRVNKWVSEQNMTPRLALLIAPRVRTVTA
jgi:hypothetical protein